MSKLCITVHALYIINDKQQQKYLKNTPYMILLREHAFT